MPKKTLSRRVQQQLLERWLHETVRLIAEGLHDRDLAQRKAAAALAVDIRQYQLNAEKIEAALLAYRQVFQSDRQPQVLAALRAVAIEALKFFADFEPRLVGDVLSGSADQHSTIRLHLFHEPPEEVLLFLLERGIPHRQGERRLKIAGESATFPCFRFLAGANEVEVTVLDWRYRKHPPLPQASLSEVEKLLREKNERDEKK
jgi:hypothetical protein